MSKTVTTPSRTEWLDAVLPSLAPEVRSGGLSVPQAQNIAVRYLAEFWPGACCAFLYGSAGNGQFTAYSDVDLLLIVPSSVPANAIRCVYEGVPIEAHLFDDSGFARNLLDSERSGVPGVALAVRDALALVDHAGNSQRYRDAAARTFARGPNAIGSAGQRYLCRNITNKIADMLEPESEAERSIVAAALRELLYHAHFARTGGWRYAGKWAARFAPDFGEQLDAALHRAQHVGNFDELIALAGNELSPFGGFRWVDEDVTERESHYAMSQSGNE